MSNDYEVLAVYQSPLFSLHIEDWMVDEYDNFESFLDAVYDWLYQERPTFEIVKPGELKEFYDQSRIREKEDEDE